MDTVPTMVSFGNLGGLRSYQLFEVQSDDMLGDLISQLGLKIGAMTKAASLLEFQALNLEVLINFP